MKQSKPSSDNATATQPTQKSAITDWLQRLSDRVKRWCDQLTPTERKRLTFIGLGVYLLIFILVIIFTIF